MSNNEYEEDHEYPKQDETCPDCEGTGFQIGDDGEESCDNCAGSGEVD
ncbi:hypothetical protein LNTAR_01887 [Lentisphaera araneosa HTCC2155]|uniref:Chaperone protein DnaJ n=1 Tax=Lentisphaera araneosa HTCC2155 TaxID=313628 RepID=A6DNY7_9BACT|nr:hypothetical protein [Lentisphaera araneosa]EDM26519.1 hypothetical protein LNTAR_01887 [Lentisphaera araneosa HTCC2155]